MPGKYLEYIKAGRFVVPVEITFLQTNLMNELTRQEEFSSKWANRDDWKEIKSLLKPAVESCLKCNDYLPEKVPKLTQLAFGREVGLGYAIDVNKDKCPFFAVLDAKKNCWTDDEDEEVDEDSGFKSYGGSFKSFTPTKYYLKVVVVRKTFSTSDDGKRIQKSMGGITDDIRQYYKPANSSATASIIPATGLNATTKDKNGSKQAFDQTLIHQVGDRAATRNRTILDSKHLSDSESELTITKEKFPNRRANRSKYSILPIKLGPDNDVSFPIDIRNNIEGSYYEEVDEDGDDLDLDLDEDFDLFSHIDTNGPTPYFRNSIMAIEEDDEDDESLPDIIDSPAMLRESERIEKKYSSDEPNFTKSKNSASSTTLLDFTNVFKSAGSSSSTHDTDAVLSFGSGIIQKQKSYLNDINSATRSEAVLESGKKKGHGISRIGGTKKRKSSKNPTSVITPVKLSSTKKLNLVTSLQKNRNKSPLKLPVYFNKKSKTQKHVKQNSPANVTDNSPTVVATTITHGKSKSPRPKLKQKKEIRRKKVVPEPDPEMPVLEKMAHYTEPTRSHSSISRLPKTEPASLKELPAVALASRAPAVALVPATDNLASSGSQRDKPRRRGKNKDEETQAIIDNDKSETPAASKMPTQIILSNADNIDNMLETPSSLSTETEESLAILSKDFPIAVTTAESPDTTVTLESDEDEESNLFSFEHLSKCSSPNVIPRANIPSSSPPPEITYPFPAPAKSMMPPPVMRPPRTPKKTQLVFPQSQNTIIPVNLNAAQNLTTGGFNGTATKPNRLVVNSKTQLSAMSTYQLLSNQNTLLAGFGLLSQLATKEINAEEVGVRLGLQEARRKRAASPDICLGPVRRKRRPELMESRLRPRRNANGTEKGRSNSSTLEVSPTIGQDRHGGEALVGELFSRWDKEMSHLNSTQLRYEAQGDEFDMSQSSFCMVNVYPRYEQKSRTYKMHSKNISELTIEALTEHFNVINSQILDIFAQRIDCERHQLFLEGHQQRNNLRDLNVSVPFNHDHGMTLMNLLADLLVPNPLHRPMWTDYINFVMLPESFIRIYAHVNQIPYKRADAEMRFGACYDDDSIHQ